MSTVISFDASWNSEMLVSSNQSGIYFLNVSTESNVWQSKYSHILGGNWNSSHLSRGQYKNKYQKSFNITKY